MKILGYFCLFLCFSCGVKTQLTLPDAIVNLLINLPFLNCDIPEDPRNADVGLAKIYFYNSPSDDVEVYYVSDAAAELHNRDDFKLDYKMILLCPGYGAKPKDFGGISEIIMEYKNIPDTYVMVLDYSNYTGNASLPQELLLNYRNSVRLLPDLGKLLAQFLADLIDGGFLIENIHVVGGSFGAQIGGFTGKEFNKLTGKLLKRITGLDPAGPCFNTAPRTSQLNSLNAEFVDVYHTNMGQLGNVNSYATADFYPNGGGPVQPACQTANPFGSIGCSHSFIGPLWLESIKYPEAMYGRKCRSWQRFRSGQCSANEITIAGNSASEPANGKYYFYTNNQTLYGRGKPGASP